VKCLLGPWCVWNRLTFFHMNCPVLVPASLPTVHCTASRLFLRSCLIVPLGVSTYCSVHVLQFPRIAVLSQQFGPLTSGQFNFPTCCFNRLFYEPG
jgi:hypothetical protein